MPATRLAPCVCPACGRARRTFGRAQRQDPGPGRSAKSPEYFRTLRTMARNILLRHNDPEAHAARMERLRREDPGTYLQTLLEEDDA